MVGNDIQGVLPLGEKERVAAMLNSHTKEVMQRTKIFHGKLILQSSNNTVE